MPRLRQLRRSKKARPYRFQPPRHVPWVMAIARRITPLVLRSKLGITQVAITDTDRQKLDALRGQRVVLTPNHPSMEPVVLFQLSTMLGLEFCWMTSREQFEIPVEGWVVARTGAYSINRGARDLESLQATRRLLKDGKHWLVLFPEGEAHHLHDLVLPFLPGAARLGLGALRDIAQTGSAMPPLYLVPLALRYHYLADMRPAMLASLQRLERKLGLGAPPAASDWHQRLGRIADRLLDANEDYYGVTPEPEDDLQTRLDRLRELVLRRVAESLGTEPPPPGKPLRNRLRKLFAAADRIIHAKAVTGGEYAQELQNRRRRRALRLKDELRRVLVFVAMTGTYSFDVPTVENYLDVLSRLELEVFHRARVWGPRCATIRVDEPVDLRQYYDRYLADADETSEAVILEVEHAVRALLKESAALMIPLPAD